MIGYVSPSERTTLATGSISGSSATRKGSRKPFQFLGCDSIKCKRCVQSASVPSKSTRTQSFEFLPFSKPKSYAGAGIILADLVASAPGFATLHPPRGCEAHFGRDLGALRSPVTGRLGR